MAQGCDPTTEYNAFSGGTPTIHAVYTNSSGDAVVQCNTVKIGPGGYNN
jgi:hypothetical protein|tara:strand:- start:12613 stop:12759 length:147 start_codon:yes stop_codon:yes gene_type:complete